MSGESGDQEMNQNDRRRYLIEELLEERPEYENMQIPSDADEQKMLLRSLMNIRMPKEIDPAFLQIQDAYLSEENEKKGMSHWQISGRCSLICISGRVILQDLEWEQS